MKKLSKLGRVVIGVLVFALSVPPTSLIFSSEDIEVQKAVQYLSSQTADPWITMALAAADQENLNLDHLQEVNGNLATDYEKTILALTAAGEDPRTFGNIDFVAQLENFYQSNQIGSPDLLNDDFWGILALVSAGEDLSVPIIKDSENFILVNQNSDGGWSYAVSGQSDTNDTAVAVMALLELGYTPDNSAITKAIEYLKANQNSDGGFSYSPGAESDSGSDSWVISAIYKLGQNPYDWQKEGQNPIDHLKLLQRSDGSFKWVGSEDSGYPVLTANALIALSGNYYPVNRLYHLRIEGNDNQICETYIKGKTALDIVENGAEICNYTYFIEQTSWGPYLKKINSEEAHDLIGWLYFVNWQTLSVGAADYNLKPGDEILWYFGEWGAKPIKLSLNSQQANTGGNSEANVKYLEVSQWNNLTGASIYVGDSTFTTDEEGNASLTINTAGIFQAYAQKLGYVRSNKIALSVGEGVSQGVDLSVEIIPSSTPEVAFNISKNQIDFGKLAPGTQTNDQLIIRNTGSSQISLEGIVEGNQIFRENITLDGLNWRNFSATVNANLEKNVSVGLVVPSNWTSFGVKEGNLTFWAITE